MREAKKPRKRSVQGIPAGEPSPRWFTSKPDPLAFCDEIRLTDDERLTLEGLAKGYTLRQVQVRLDCAYGVIQRHRDSIYRKLAATNDAHAVALAYQTGEL